MTTQSLYELLRKRAVSLLGLNPFPWYKHMRMTAPISIDEQNQLCELFCYKDVQAVLLEPCLFSSKGRFSEEEDEGDRGGLAAIDPPRHGELRALVSQAFTPRTIAQQANTIRGIVNELLDASSTSNTLEVVRDLASPLPMRVIVKLMGIPLSRQDDFRRWTEQALGHSQEQGVAGFLALENYMRELIMQKRQEKQDDLVSTLLEAQIDGEPLSEQEIVDFCVGLLGAGIEATRHLIANIILCLDEHPSAREQVWADPSLVSSTIEEVLRFRPVGHRLVRLATRDTEIGGKQIKAGYRIFAWTGSANRDEEKWSDPEVLDIRRSPNPHLEFGYGIHACLGAQLGRLQAKIVLEQIIERFKDIQYVREVALTLAPSFLCHGPQQLPIHVQKR